MGQKGASAKNVGVEEAAVQVEETREFGTIKVLSLLRTEPSIGTSLGQWIVLTPSYTALERGERLRIHWSRFWWGRVSHLSYRAGRL